MKRFADFKKLQRHTYLKLKGIQIARLAWRRNLRVCKLTLSQATWEKEVENDRQSKLEENT